jgi:PPOX class probable F420-dependent enzyme
MRDLGSERYVNLATFRKNGREVRTPVWIAREGSKLYVWTNGTSGKAKRIRANGRARLAPCDARGKLRGDWVDATARMLEDPEAMQRGIETVVRKYGWQMHLALLAARISGRYSQRAVIEVEATDRTG